METLVRCDGSQVLVEGRLPDLPVGRYAHGLERVLLDLTADPADGRVTCVHLSADAQRLHQSALRQRRPLAQAALQDIDADQRRLLLEQLQRMRHNIEGQA